MFPQLDKELNFGYQKNGSLVLATNKDEVKILHDLLKRGETNGVKNLRILDKKELFEMEPHINPNSISALYSPDAGNVIPYEYTIALAENAVDNGVELRIRREVVDIKPPSAGNNHFIIKARHWEPKNYVDGVKSYQKSQYWKARAICFISIMSAGYAFHQNLCTPVQAVMSIVVLVL